MGMVMFDLPDAGQAQTCIKKKVNLTFAPRGLERMQGWSGCPPDLENQRSKGERIHPDRRGLVSSWRVGNWGERRNSYCGDQVCDGEDSEIRDDSDSILLSEGALTGSRVLLTVFS